MPSLGGSEMCKRECHNSDNRRTPVHTAHPESLKFLLSVFSYMIRRSLPAAGMCWMPGWVCLVSSFYPKYACLIRQNIPVPVIKHVEISIDLLQMRHFPKLSLIISFIALQIPVLLCLFFVKCRSFLLINVDLTCKLRSFFHIFP